MRGCIVSLIAVSFAFNAAAQTPSRNRGEAQEAMPTNKHESKFYIKGPNAPFKNQLRKFSDPLNANGGR